MAIYYFHFYKKSIIFKWNLNIILSFAFEYRSLRAHIALLSQKREIACNIFLSSMVAEIYELFTGARKNFPTCRDSMEQTVI